MKRSHQMRTPLIALIVAIGFVASVGFNGRAATSIGRGLSPQEAPVKVGDSDRWFRWDAKVHDTGGLFVLVRSSVEGDVEIVGCVAARGSGAYELYDGSELSGLADYQLWYVDGSGRRQQLVSRTVRAQSIAPSSAPGALTPAGSPAADLALGLPATALRSEFGCQNALASYADPATAPRTPPPWPS